MPKGVPGDAFDLCLFEGGREPLAWILDKAITLGMEQCGIGGQPQQLVALLKAFMILALLPEDPVRTGIARSYFRKSKEGNRSPARFGMAKAALAGKKSN